MKSFSDDLYCVFGNPVAHSRSPSIHARFAALTGQRMVYERRLLQLDQFQEGIRAFIAAGGRGCNITVPFKFDAPALANVCSERVLLAGAANTLSFHDDGTIAADNTDGLGLVADIVRNARVELKGKRLLLVGAGGAAAGVLGPLLDAGVAHVTIANRTLAKAQALIASHSHIALRHGGLLGRHVGAQGVDVLGRGVAHEGARQLHFQHAAHGEHLARFGRRRAGDKGATGGLQRDQALLRKLEKRLPHQRARYGKVIGQRLLDQLAAGPQAMFNNGAGQRLGDGLGGRGFHGNRS